MFFTISKLFGLLLSPLLWFFAIAFVGFFVRARKKKMYVFFAAFFVLLLFSNKAVFHFIGSKWEEPYTEIENVKVYDYGILLGGMISIVGEGKLAYFSRSGDRLLQTINLYKKGKIRKIIVTGALGNLNHKISEAAFLAEYLMYAGVPKEDILLEEQSLNTYENAQNCKLLINNNIDSSQFLIISSGFHLKRAKACFTKAGFRCDGFACEPFIFHENLTVSAMLMPNEETLSNWYFLLHEWVGYAVYKWKGYL